MGSFIEINDTLQITKAQGFPKELDYDIHAKTPFKAAGFQDIVFEFNGKQGIRIYKAPPVRNFLVENVNGKWLYWGLIYIVEITHDYLKKTTSGKYKIIYLYSPEEMQQAHQLVDRNKETDYFKQR